MTKSKHEQWINALTTDGFRYDYEKQDYLDKKAKKLEERWIIEVQRSRIYKCVNSMDKDYSSLRWEELMCRWTMKEREDWSLECNRCRRPWNKKDKNVTEHRAFVSVNKDELARYIEKQLEMTRGSIEDLEKINQDIWEAKCDWKKYKFKFFEEWNTIKDSNNEIIKIKFEL